MPSLGRIQPIPMVVISEYQVRLVSVVNEWQRITLEAVDKGVITRLLSELRADDALSNFESITAGLEREFLNTMPTVAEYAADAYGRTDAIHKKRWQDIVQKTYGVVPFLPEDWQDGFIRAFVADNVSLMKNLSTETVRKITNDVLGGARSGVRATEIAKNLQKDFGVTKSRAKLIARDQVSKLYGQLNEHRQEDLGITKYQWSTSDDDRVRHSHDLNDDEIMRWNNSNVVLKDGRWVTRTGYKGIPGQDIQCRCVAYAVLPDRLP